MGHLQDDVFLLLRPEFISFFLFIFKFGGPSEVFLPPFLDTGLPGGNVHEGNSGPMRGAIPTQSHNP